MYYLTTSFQCTVITRRFKLYGDIDQNIWIGISDQSDICFINRLNIHKSHWVQRPVLLPWEQNLKYVLTFGYKQLYFIVGQDQKFLFKGTFWLEKIDLQFFKGNFWLKKERPLKNGGDICSLFTIAILKKHILNNVNL